MLRSLFPSMFHRRLWLLFACVAAAGAVMAGQAYRLTVVQHEAHLKDAESRLVTERWTSTVRGRILDRKGRVLAKDEPSFDILVDYPVISEDWAWSRAQRQARRENRHAWAGMKKDERDALIRAALPAYREQLDAMWQHLSQALSLSRDELEQRRADIRRDVQSMSMSIYERWLERRREEEARQAGSPADITLADVQRPLDIQVQGHAIARGVPEEVGFVVRRLAQRYPGISVEPSGRRTYPFESVDVNVDRSTFPAPLRPVVQPPAQASDDPSQPPVAPTPAPPLRVRVEGLATHVLGWMRSLHAEDSGRRPMRKPSGEIDLGHYQPSDPVGGSGIEAGYESTLRGLRGRRIRHLDIPDDEPGAEEVIEPVSGRDVTLTIDVNLQARVHALMSPEAGLATVQPWHHPAVIPEGQPAPLPIGTPLNGAAVVYEIDSGEILAMVSTPSFTREQFQQDSQKLLQDKVNVPWVNRAIAKPYPPGSIVKPLILSAAATEGVYSLTRAIECTGHLIPDKPQRYRCWVYKQFNQTHTGLLGRSLLAPEAMAVSCNIFFYTLGRELGPARIKKWYESFGAGRGFELKIGDEYAGEVGAVPKTEQFALPHAILMGIGQGPIAWTPLHAAEAYAVLARGGLHLVPRIVKDETPRATDLKIDPQALDAALEGLRQSVNEDFGTGHALKFADGTKEPIFFPREGIEVIGKTGTADAPEIAVDRDPSPDRVSREVLRDGDHSWFVVMVGKKGVRPKYVVSVIMEYAGSGGRVAGPVCNQIIEALIAEGYL